MTIVEARISIKSKHAFPDVPGEIRKIETHGGAIIDAIGLTTARLFAVCKDLPHDWCQKLAVLGISAQ